MIWYALNASLFNLLTSGTIEMDRKPHKVWSADRRKRKSVVVSSFQELKERG